MPTLRPHQQENLDHLREETMAGRNPLLVAACGYGKGTIASVMVQRAVDRGHHVVFAVHGKSLVVDMSQRIQRLGIEHGVLLGGERRERWHKVQVASIDTLHRMEHPPKASLILVDEAHMALSPTWRKTLARYPNARVIGMTATPIRLDGKGLGSKTGGLFDSMVLGPSEEELIGLGHLVPSRVLAPPVAIGDVKKTAGDFNQKALAAVCDKTKLIGDIVDHWKRHANEKTAAFGVDQAHAKHIQESFQSAGIQWAYVDAQTPQEERAEIWRDLDSGSLMGVSSVGCIAVGWDHPIVSCLIMARPTASLGLWKQMLGRGSRPHPGKARFLVLDHSGNTHRHAPFGMFEDAVPWSLDGAAVTLKDADKQPPPIATCKQSFMWPDGRHQPPNIINGLQWPCYATFRAGPKECPYCGLPQKVKARAVEVEQGDLKEIVRATTQEQAAARTAQRIDHDDLMEKAYAKNYKPAWVGMCFKSKHGFWPPKAWSVEWYGKRLKDEMEVSA